MRLWNKSFGKETKVFDFAGRSIAKGAYNDRKSEFGWNVDHILPQSRGGTTADHNLICCHMLTNDEKADKFPCFRANGVAFEIIKVQNHYEIRAKNQKAGEKTEVEDVNFYDSAAGLRLFKKLKGVQNRPRFVGTVFIKLFGVTNTAVVDFVREVMDEEHLSFESKNLSNSVADITIITHNHNLPLREDISELLNKCGLLNTYFSSYFQPSGYVEGFDIYYRLDCFVDKFGMYGRFGNINKHNMNYGTTVLIPSTSGQKYQNSLFVNDLVVENTGAAVGEKKRTNSEYAEYKFVYTQLNKNLEKEVNGK